MSVAVLIVAGVVAAAVLVAVCVARRSLRRRAAVLELVYTDLNEVSV